MRKINLDRGGYHSREDYKELLQSKLVIKRQPTKKNDTVTIIDAPVNGKLVKFTFLGEVTREDINRAVSDTQKLAGAIATSPKGIKIRKITTVAEMERHNGRFAKSTKGKYGRNLSPRKDSSKFRGPDIAFGKAVE